MTVLEKSVKYDKLSLPTDPLKGIVVDAGANIGQYTLIAAAIGTKVYAFEPVPNHVRGLLLT